MHQEKLCPSLKEGMHYLLWDEVLLLISKLYQGKNSSDKPAKKSKALDTFIIRLVF